MPVRTLLNTLPSTLFVVVILLAVTLTACVQRTKEQLQSPHQTREFTLLAVNDVYRIDGVEGGTVGGLARLRQLRIELEKEAPDLLVLHAGDMLFPSTLSRLYQGEQMIDVMNKLDGDARAFDTRLFATFGNHEFDKSKMKHLPMLTQRIQKSDFYWLHSNIEFVPAKKDVSLHEVDHLVRSKVIESGGVRIGIFSLTTDFLQPDYVARFLDPFTIARKMTRRLRSEGAEVVVALTHLSMAQDIDLLKRLGDRGPDLIIGGHEHVQQQSEIDGRWVLKADADAVSATVIKGRVGPDGTLAIEFHYRQLDQSVAKDAFVQTHVNRWLSQFDRDYCTGVLGQPQACLKQVLTHTRVPLIAEELQIRRYETNLGNWVVDRALEAFADRGAQVAFINSGTLRLNQNMDAGAVVTSGHVEELFGYPSPLKLIRIKGETLYRIAERAIQERSGNGWWLQVAGFAFRFDPASDTVSDIALLTPDGPRAVKPDDDILAVTGTYLINGGDGYTMLNKQLLVDDAAPAVDFKALVRKALEAAGDRGIAPTREGRICEANLEPCLLATED